MDDNTCKGNDKKKDVHISRKSSKSARLSSRDVITASNCPESANEDPINGADFPKLGASGSEIDSISPWIWRKRQKEFPKLSSNSQKDEPGTFSVEPIKCPDKKESKTLKTTDVDNVKKMKRSKRPILLDFSSALKIKRLGREKTIMTIGLRQAKPYRLDSRTDDPHPVKKGKQRERKKVKLSRLKTEIIRERIRKSLTDQDQNEVPFKEQVRIYLENLRLSNEGRKDPDNTKSKSSKTDTHYSATFTCKFKSYCDNIITEELNAAVKELIKSLIRLQDKAFKRDPIRARAKKRYVVGLRESAKYLKLKKVKLLIIAPDLEATTVDGELNKTIEELKENAKTENVPYVFALNRRKLGYSTLRKAPVSCFAILIYEGLEDQFKEVINNTNKAREEFLKSCTTADLGIQRHSSQNTPLPEINLVFNNLSITDSDDQSEKNPFLKSIESSL